MVDGIVEVVAAADRTRLPDERRGLDAVRPLQLVEPAAEGRVEVPAEVGVERDDAAVGLDHAARRRLGAVGVHEGGRVAGDGLR